MAWQFATVFNHEVVTVAGVRLILDTFIEEPEERLVYDGKTVIESYDPASDSWKTRRECLYSDSKTFGFFEVLCTDDDHLYVLRTEIKDYAFIIAVLDKEFRRESMSDYLDIMSLHELKTTWRFFANTVKN